MRSKAQSVYICFPPTGLAFRTQSLYLSPHSTNLAIRIYRCKGRGSNVGGGSGGGGGGGDGGGEVGGREPSFTELINIT